MRRSVFSILGLVSMVSLALVQGAAADDDTPMIEVGINPGAEVGGGGTTEGPGLCDPVDPACESQISQIIRGLRILKPEVEGGVMFAGGQAGGAVRFSLEGISLDTPVGDLDLLQFAAVYLPDAGGFRLRLKLADSDVLFFCRDADTGETHAPLMAMFNNCVPEGIVGIGGSLLDFQWDIQTSRVMARWLEANVVVNFLRNGNGTEYLNHRLTAFLGASLDTMFPGDVPGGDPNTAVMPRLNMGIAGMLRTANNRLEIHGYAGYRPNLLDFTDFAVEGEVKLLYNFLFSRNVMGQVGLHGAASYWSVPSHSIGDFASDQDRESIYVGGLFRLMFR
ncbi:MAG: hypothetical protein IT285_03800 [Bdellovibrionales bacterium]|nr:hypothetical protein [Bdellovibrionales bacterium]